jgi:steroid 5-alpha reductase family enzyme
MPGLWTEALSSGATAVAVLMVLFWALGVAKADASLVDRIWGLGFVVAMAGYVAGAGAPDWRAALVFALVALWGLRLSWHLHRRNSGHGEDARYTEMRRRHGKSFVWKSLFYVNLLQGLILVIVSLPLVAVATGTGPGSVTAWDVGGVLVWVVGFTFEVVGDAQLRRFRADPGNKGKVLDSGLWSLTRHPNYFGDATLWWGFGLVACSTPGGYWTLVGPALMTFFLRRVSGVTLLEKSMMERKPGYADYVARTPPFIPRPPWITRKAAAKAALALLGGAALAPFARPVLAEETPHTMSPSNPAEKPMTVGEFFNKANKDNMKEMVERFYAEDVVFEDPIVSLKSRADLLKHYENLYKDVEKIRFDIGAEVRQGDDQFSQWTMYLNTPNLNGGETVVVPGVSQIRFRGDKAVYHRDYFDMGAMVYEHVTGLGWIVRKVKGALTPDFATASGGE